MLSVKRMSASSVDYFLDLASRDEYYTNGGEPPGRWVGEGCNELGLEGEIIPNDFRNIFNGFSPDGTLQLVKFANREGVAQHFPGWDFTYSADKSISVLWSQATPEQRKLIEQDIRDSVLTVTGILEETAIYTRRGAGGKLFEPSSLIAAAYEHCTSRSGEPNLHIHLLIMNVGVRPDGKFGTLSGAHLFTPNLKMTFGALMRAELACRLEGRGLEIERRDRFSGVAHVSEELIDRFSTRRNEIEQELDAIGEYSAVASASAALKTRQAKEFVVRERLIEQWETTGREYGWSEPQARALFGRYVDKRDHHTSVREALDAACRRATKDVSHFNEREFIRAVAEESPGRGLGANEIIATAERYLQQSPNIVRLGVQKRQPRYTTLEVIEEERALITLSQQMADRTCFDVKPETAMRCLAQEGERPEERLTEEQMKAVWHMTVDTKGVSFLSGYAGTGKTQLLKKAYEIWQAEGYEVFGTALAGKAQAELQQKTGIPSRNVAQLLADVSKGQALPRNSILVLDEAGMVSTRSWLRLSRAAAESNSKLVAVGHEKQLQPIDRGGPFLELGNRFGRVELIQNLRQRHEWAKGASYEMAEGKAASAIKTYVEKGLVSIYDTRREALNAVAAQWAKDGMNPYNGLMMAGTNRDVVYLNRLARAQLKAAGLLGDAELEFDGKKFSVGDTVMLMKTAAPRGISRGDRGQITALDFESQSISMMIYAGRHPSHKVTVSLADYPHLDYGYAMSTHRAQGASALHAYILVGGDFQHRELSYVQVSRSVENTWLFTTQSETGDTLATLAKEMERSRQKDMAISVEMQQEPPRQQPEPTFDR